MADKARILELVEEALCSELTPEEVCAQHPELLPDVRRYLKQCRKLDSKLQELFPSSSSGSFSGPRRPVDSRVPAIPGYEILEVVGRGGIGIIYKARHLKLDRIVALKMLLSGQYASPLELARFTREAQAVAAL